ncbi:uncharacterized protein TrAtP1_001897 [Trichoderma atroviride]|uniref:Uncharacterized protein n=1 Tax=Hypocrea atroviridis (strain ATCC 20476 / IMI 206040) TaxID=452589 RepID=G9P3J4_HYPAI|nr:uncharacterized protein TRIATDRAFT_78762 [Trichoderma atroviride IMI 206040]EHK42952.1 hypothetical protein TRIATDRAFT_78762 [Trichoderma atroviride IMI 206040]UKZ60626.1 hypothetical protein TrAtP1_001897 [Trichoderma atroviride]
MANTPLPPISALKALEPRPDGHWAVYEQEGDATTLSYVMNNGTEAITYTLHQCKTEEDIRKHCAGFVYEYTDDLDAGYGAQRGGELLPEFGNTREVASQIYETQPRILPGHYSTSQNQQSFQEQFLFNAQTTMISPPESHTQANAQFEETTMTQQSQLYQEEQGYVTSEDQAPLLGGFAPGAAEWSLGSGSFPAAAENNPTSMPNIEVRMSQDMSIFMDSWEQNWANVNPNDTQGADGDWDSLLPHA